MRHCEGRIAASQCLPKLARNETFRLGCRGHTIYGRGWREFLQGSFLGAVQKIAMVLTIEASFKPQLLQANTLHKVYQFYNSGLWDILTAP